MRIVADALSCPVPPAGSERLFGRNGIARKARWQTFGGSTCGRQGVSRHFL